MEISKLMGHSIFSCTPPTVDSCPGGQSHNVDSKKYYNGLLYATVEKPTELHVGEVCKSQLQNS